MSGRPLARFACDCAACQARVEADWQRFLDGHREEADHLRRVWLGVDETPANRVVSYLAASRQAGAVHWEHPEDDGA